MHGALPPPACVSVPCQPFLTLDSVAISFSPLQALEACGRATQAAAAYRRAAELDPELEAAAGAALAAAERLASRERCLAVLQGHRGAIYDAAAHPKVTAVAVPNLPCLEGTMSGAPNGHTDFFMQNVHHTLHSHHRLGAL